MTSLLHRTPDRVDEIKLGILGEVNKLLDKLKSDLEQGLADPDVTAESLAQTEILMREDALNRAWGHSLMRATESEIVNTGIINMAWGIHVIPRGYDNLLTSDKPIVKSNGLAHSAGYISLALGPKVLFIATNNKATLDNILGSGAGILVHNFNKAVCNQAIEYAYGFDKSQLFFVEEWLAKHEVPTY